MPQLGAIASGHHVAAEAGAQVHNDGGNAVDAAIASAFVSCTCEPTLTGPGGAGFATVMTPDGKVHAFDFFASVPGLGLATPPPGGPVPIDVQFGITTQTFHVGSRSCAVPGFVAGVLAIHERFGRLPLAHVLEPGIEIARHGLVLEARQAYCHELLEKILTRGHYGRSIFQDEGGRFLGDDDHFVQPLLADTLELLAMEGADAFYRGEIAHEIVRWAEEHDGLITARDLAEYRISEHVPVRAKYRNFELVSVAEPSSGGVLVAHALRILDAVRGSGVINPDTPPGAALLVAVMEAANAVRGEEFERHLYDGSLTTWLLSDEQLERGIALVHARQQGASHPTSPMGSTTQLSVIDAEGFAISMTTSTGCGAGEFVGNTGIQLNNMLGEEDLTPVSHQLSPGDRLTSMMAPSLVLHDGKALMATGSAGSSRLRSAIVQTMVRALDSRDYAG
ncbi:MAG: gamma-glutamyltransferase, partial [Thermoleophilia bacterium]|nr:gamma-glutamyltransferase [Thermoleophilia bacterium]